MKTILASTLAAVVLIGASGCTTWDKLSQREKGAAIGVGVGAVTGAVLTDGNVLGTVGGAAVGGVIGNQVGK